MTDELRRFFPIERFGEIQSSAPIDLGLSGARVHVVATSAGEFVLRQQERDRESWARAIAAQRIAAERGIAPPLVSVDEDAMASITRRVAGVPFGPALAEPSARRAALESLVQQVAQLHAIRVPAVATMVVDAEVRAPVVWASQTGRPGFPAWAVPLGARLEEACATIAEDPRRVFSHNDLHPRNVLWDGTRTWLFDWERAGLSHPYIDLATLSNFLNLPDDAAVALVAAQEGAALEAHEQRVFATVRTFCRLVYGAVFLHLVPDLVPFELGDRAHTPTLPECYRQMAAGALDPATPRGQALLGAAFLAQCA